MLIFNSAGGSVLYLQNFNDPLLEESICQFGLFCAHLHSCGNFCIRQCLKFQNHYRVQIGYGGKGWELSGTESRIANRTIPSIVGRNRQNFRSKEQKNESNRGKVESQKINIESPSKSHPNNA